MPAMRKFLSLAAALAVSGPSFVVMQGASEAHAAALTLTETYDPADWTDSKNAVGSILADVWSVEAKQEFGAYGFAYAIIDQGGKHYLVSSLRGANCTPSSCTWRIQRLSSSYAVEAKGSAFEACGETLRADVRTVFASRHGAIHVAVQILASITGGEPVSPMQFSHSVHNAQAGLYSIAAGNREASSSLAGEADTCACAWIEALAHMERAPGAAVLVTIADEPLPPRLLPLVDEPASAYAVSFLLRRADDADPDAIGLRIAPGGAAAAPERSAPLAWPQALELARWWLAGASEPLALGARRRHDTDFYLSATKLWLAGLFDRNVFANATLRYSRANQGGLLGFGGDRDDSRDVLFEGSAGVFVNRYLALGFEYRQQPDNLGFSDQDDWFDVFVGVFPNKHVSIVAESIDANVWSALGTRAHGESTQTP